MRLPVIRSTLHRAAEHRVECAVESLALAIGLRAIRSSARLIDSKSRAQFGEESRFELRAAIKVHLLWHSVARDLFWADGAGTRRGAFGSNGDRLCPTGEAVDHYQNGLGRWTERERDLAAYNVDVERAVGLFGWQVTKHSAWKRVIVAIMIAFFACLCECKEVTADARPPEALCDAAQPRVVAMVRGFVLCAKHVFAKSGRYNNASGDGALIAVLEERVFDDELWLHVCEYF